MSEWVKIRSWHLAKEYRDGDWAIKTLCGRAAPLVSDVADDRPQGKTCETCLRIKVGR